jgi:hypothetical protein
LNIKLKLLLGLIFAVRVDRHCARLFFVFNFFVFGSIAGHVPDYPIKSGEKQNGPRPLIPQKRGPRIKLLAISY